MASTKVKTKYATVVCERAYRIYSDEGAPIGTVFEASPGWAVQYPNGNTVYGVRSRKVGIEILQREYHGYI